MFVGPRPAVATKAGESGLQKVSCCSGDSSCGHAIVFQFSRKCMERGPSRFSWLPAWIEKVHAVVARSTFPSQNVQNTSASDHFWKLRCQKSARRCGAKHISKSKVLKTDGLGPLLEVQMSKKCQKSARRCGTKHISKLKV